MHGHRIDSGQNTAHGAPNGVDLKYIDIGLHHATVIGQNWIIVHRETTKMLDLRWARNEVYFKKNDDNKQ